MPEIQNNNQDINKTNNSQQINVEAEVVNDGGINIDNYDFKSPSIKDLVKDSSIGFFEYIVEFEEKHPWVFFVGIALILFVIIGAVLSIFSRGNFNFIPNFFDGESEEIIENEIISQEALEKEIEKEIVLKAATVGKESGFLLTSLEGYDSLVFKGDSDVFLYDELSFAKQLKYAISTNIVSELNLIKEKEDRLNHLRDYLVYLIDLEKQASTYYLKLGKMLGNFTIEKDFYRKKKDEAREKVNDSFETGGINELTSALKDLNEFEDKYDYSDNKFNLVKNIYNIYKSPLQLAQARIAAIRANKEILLLGLKVFSINQAGLDLIRTDEVITWYKSEAPIGEKIKHSTSSGPIKSKPTTTNESYKIPQLIGKETLDSIMP